MITINAVWLFSLIGIAAIALTLLGMLLFNSTLFHKEFSLLRNFPFEFGRMNEDAYRIFKPFMFVLTGLAFSPLFVIVPLSKDFGDLAFLTIFITSVFGLSAIVNSLLFFFDARYTKTHLLLVTIAICLTLLANALATLLSVLVFKVYLDMSENHISSLVLAIISGLIVVIMLLIAFNPKLANWAKLQSVENDSGEKTYSRGKIFVLAFIEWLTIALSILGELVFLFSIIK